MEHVPELPVSAHSPAPCTGELPDPEDDDRPRCRCRAVLESGSERVRGRCEECEAHLDDAHDDDTEARYQKNEILREQAAEEDDARVDRDSRIDHTRPGAGGIPGCRVRG